MTDDMERNDLNSIVNERNGSNIAILEPDIGLGNHTANRTNRSSDHTRREESSISFRRFLQNDGNRLTHPDLYTCSRQDRSNDGIPLGPESPDLPDFVQDHLAVEQIYLNDGTLSTNDNLPDFASFMPGNNSQCNYQADRKHRRLINRVPLDLPVPNFSQGNTNDRSQFNLTLPFDLTTDSNEINVTGNGSQLPDFLSDGHILGHDSAAQKDISGTLSYNNNNLQQDFEERTSLCMLERDNERLRQELHNLQCVMMKKNDRIRELEDIVMALETSKLQFLSDASTQTMNCRENTNSIERPEPLHATSSSNTSVNDYRTNANLALKVRKMSNVSERLVRELLKIITDLQIDINKEDLLRKDSELSTEENAANTCSQNSLQSLPDQQ